MLQTKPSEHGKNRAGSGGELQMTTLTVCQVIVWHTSIFQEGEVPASRANWEHKEVCQT